MDLNTAKQMVGQVVQSDCEIWGILEYVTADGWAGIRAPKDPMAVIAAREAGTTAPKGRLDEIQVPRLEVDPT